MSLCAGRPWRGGVDLNSPSALVQEKRAESPLARGRGLKHERLWHLGRRYVAPRAGAWIETPRRPGQVRRAGSPLARGIRAAGSIYAAV